MAEVSFEDFYQVPNLKFDISLLKKDLEKVLERKKFCTPGITHFGAIPLNRIPNDQNSIEGNNVRGKYWTIADESGKEVISVHELIIFECGFIFFNCLM